MMDLVLYMGCSQSRGIFDVKAAARAGGRERPAKDRET